MNMIICKTEVRNMKKNIYLIQPTFMSDSSVYLPYAIGALASYAWSFEDISENYELKKVFFLREKILEIIDSLESPFMVGFSNYIWNFEYNKQLAQLIKNVFPECIIVFGGPQISETMNLLVHCNYIDILIYYEGEVAFRDLLRAYINNTGLDTINNISYRSFSGDIIDTSICVPEVFDFPSPYESGFFDKLVEEYPDIDFVPLIETNRGCPNMCSYCSWGKIKSKVRFFPIERVFSDIEWASRHKADFLGIADANFGMFPRDEEIVDKIISCKKKYGYPRKFQVSYSKGDKERVFRIAEKLNKNDMDKGVTLSFQSMSEKVQRNIGRPNIDIEEYKHLIKKYSVAGIATYTDLILGLPGETYKSFQEGIDTLLEQGQHMSLFIHLCEWLPLAEMAKEDYMKQHQIRYSVIPLNQPHTSNRIKDIQEYSRIVTSTSSMSSDDWKKMVMFSTCILCFHHLGLLQFVALYLFHEKKIRYSCFYSDLLQFLLYYEDHFDVFRVIKEKVDRVIDANGSVVVFDEFFGNIAWPFEEYAFLKLVVEKELFYQKIEGFLSKYISDQKLLKDLISYQKFVIKTINNKSCDCYSRYDWKEYFDSLLSGIDCEPLREKKIHYILNDDNIVLSWPEYAKKILWFGRRGGKNIYTSEIKEENEKL